MSRGKDVITKQIGGSDIITVITHEVILDIPIELWKWYGLFYGTKYGYRL